MKKSLGLNLMLLGMGVGSAFGDDVVRVGDIVNLKILDTQRYVIPYGKALVASKSAAGFQIVADLNDLTKDVGKAVNFGDLVYFRSMATGFEEVPYFICNVGKKTSGLLYGAKRDLPELGQIAQNPTKYEVKSSVNMRGRVYYGNKIQLQDADGKFLSINVSGVWTSKGGPEVFESGDSKLSKATRELTFEKVGEGAKPTWQGGKTPATDRKGPKIGEKLNYYKVLGVDKNADNKTIERKYRQISLKIHPDKVDQQDRKKAEEAFKLIGNIKETLSDPEKKKAYDAWLRTGGSAPAGIEVIEEEIYNFIKEKTK